MSKKKQKRAYKMKLLTNPGFYFGALLAAVSMAAFLCLANPHDVLPCQTEVKTEKTVKQTPMEQMSEAIKEARKLADAKSGKREYKKGLYLLSMKIEEISEATMTKPLIESLYIQGLMLLEGATIGEEFLNDSGACPSGLDKVSCLNNYKTAKVALEQLRALLVVSQELDSLDPELMQGAADALQKAEEGIRRLTIQLRKEKSNDLIPFPSLPGR